MINDSDVAETGKRVAKAAKNSAKSTWSRVKNVGSVVASAVVKAAKWTKKMAMKLAFGALEAWKALKKKWEAMVARIKAFVKIIADLIKDPLGMFWFCYAYIEIAASEATFVFEVELGIKINKVPNTIGFRLDSRQAFWKNAVALFPGLWKSIKRVYLSLTGASTCREETLGLWQPDLLLSPDLAEKEFQLSTVKNIPDTLEEAETMAFGLCMLIPYHM